jgi:hypothetical protein
MFVLSKSKQFIAFVKEIFNFLYFSNYNILQMFESADIIVLLKIRKQY